MANFLPLEDGRYLAAGEGRTQAEVAKFSARDAEQARRLRAAAGARSPRSCATSSCARRPTSSEGGWLSALPELLEAASLGRRIAGLDQSGRRDLLDLFAKSAGDWLDGWFESDPIKALFGFDSVVGNYASPYTPGSAYVLLHHVFGEVNGRKGAWGHAIGGMGAITQAMARACADGRRRDPPRFARRRGADGSRPRRRRRHRGRRRRAGPRRRLEPASAPAVRAAGRSRHRAGRLLASASAAMPSGSGTFRMNVALSELPRFTCLPEAGDHLTAGIIIAPEPRLYGPGPCEARLYGWSREPIVEMLIPSTLDDSLAPPGRHVASLFCQHVAPVLPDGADWDDHRDAVADLMIDTVERHAPGFKASVLGRMALTPADLEQRFGLVGGDIFHGRLTLDQLFSARPVLGHADYRMPVPGLYLCGSGTHPGGGVTGAPGHNAAHAVLRDLARRRRN